MKGEKYFKYKMEIKPTSKGNTVFVTGRTEDKTFYLLYSEFEPNKYVCKDKKWIIKHINEIANVEVTKSGRLKRCEKGWLMRNVNMRKEEIFYD